MPQTINGIGTRYYGKRDMVSRVGPCRSCGVQGKLQSYDSRLWFVVFFIPMIPLKRVRILDYCPNCSRHWAADPDEYEASRQLAVSGALEKYRDHPSNESALGAHAQLLSFHMHQEADDFRATVLDRFPDDVDLHIGLGAHLDQVGRWAVATPIYERVLELQPSHPGVRCAVAWRRINENRLDEAYQLLEILRQPGAGQSYDLALLKSLAQQYQRQKDYEPHLQNHERVLELCEHLLREVPAEGEKHDFRNLVNRSERALHRTESMLPQRSFSFGGLIDSKRGLYAPWVYWSMFGAFAVLLFTVGMGTLNEYRRTHRSLYVLNGFAQPIGVTIDNQPRVIVTQKERLIVSEGKHRIQITGLIQKEEEIVLETGYWSRWTYSPIWIFNFEQLVAVSESTIRYAQAPPPPTVRWLVGSELSYVPHVDYAFEPPPQTITVKGHNSTLTKISVETTVLQPAQVLSGLSHGQEKEVAMIYAEGYIARNPKDATLLRMYSQLADDDARKQRVTQFLESGLWMNPISIPWHRVYTGLKSTLADEQALLKEYDAHLLLTPNDGKLLYLRGRVGQTRADQMHYFQLANEKDPNSGWPEYALANDAANRGAWAQAKEYCDKALPPLRSDLWYRALRHGVEVANGNAASLENEYRLQLNSLDHMESMTAFSLLIDDLAAQKKSEEAQQAAHQYLLAKLGTEPAPEMRSFFGAMVDYICGNIDGLRQKREKQSLQGIPQYQFHSLLVLGDPESAVKMDGVDKLLESWSEVLSVSLAYALAGNAAEADQWRLRACEKLNEGNSNHQRAAALLQREQPPTTNELDEVVLGMADTPLFLAALSRRFPDHNSELNQRIRAVNVYHLAPALLVKQAIETP